MKHRTDFKRDFFYKIVNGLDKYNVTFLLGPRKCGKTYALDQIKNNLDRNIIKYDFKTLTEDESVFKVNEIIDSIKAGKDIVYLLDEVTYMTFPEQEIARIAEAYTESKSLGVDIKTKVVFTGSQSVALSSWGRSAFAGQANFINADFLTYSEWLDFAGVNEISADTFRQFITGTFDFYDEFNSLEDYLKGCLEETVKSNAKSRNYIYGNDVDLVSVDTLIDILYITLFSLHDTLSPATFFQNNSLSNKIVYIKNTMAKDYDISSEEIREKVARSYVSRYDSVNSVDIDVLKQSLSFLIRSSLITATPIFDNFETTIDVLKNLEADNSKYTKKSDLLGKVNFTINYPMFYAQILKDIFNDEIKNNGIDGAMLGSIVECYVRGLLDKSSSFEYHDENGNEIDYVNIRQKLAVEITISNKTMDRVHLDMLQPEYKKILLSKDKEEIIDDIKLIPYYKFIYKLSSKQEQYLKDLMQNHKASVKFTLNKDTSSNETLASVMNGTELKSSKDQSGVDYTDD